MSGLTATGGKSPVPLFALIGANTISGLGDSLAGIAIPWFVLVTTGSAAKVGLTAFFEIVPFVLAAVLGGAFIDRFGFRQTSVAADVVSGIAFGLIPLLHLCGLLRFWQILLLVFVGGMLEAPGSTARDALTPDVAAMAGMRLERVNAIMQTRRHILTLVGPSLSGLLIAAIGPANVLWLDALSFAGSALLVALAVPSLHSAKVEAGEMRRAGRRATQYMRETMDGLRFIVRDRLILSISIVSLVGNFVSSPLFGVVMPVYIRHVFGNALALGVFGVLLSAWGGGSLVGTLLYAAIGHRLRRSTLYIGAYAVGVLSAAVIAVLPPFPIILAAEAVNGLFGAPVNVIAPIIRQERTPPEMRGRVFGAVNALLMTAAPVGLLLAGSVLDRIGVQGVLIGMASIKGGMMLSLLLNPAVREMDVSMSCDGRGYTTQI